jgi:hypothetical protein
MSFASARPSPGTARVADFHKSQRRHASRSAGRDGSGPASCGLRPIMSRVPACSPARNNTARAEACHTVLAVCPDAREASPAGRFPVGQAAGKPRTPATATPENQGRRASFKWQTHFESSIPRVIPNRARILTNRIPRACRRAASDRVGQCEECAALSDRQSLGGLFSFSIRMSLTGLKA